MNIANKLTVLRILLIPVMAVLYYCGLDAWALAVFVVAAITDFLDGYLARRYGMVTDFGKFLDPIADKMLNITALVLLLWSCKEGSVQGIILSASTVVIIFRELAITGFRIIAATGGIVIAADKWGKIKTVTQDIAVLLLLLARLKFASGLMCAALGVLMLAAVLTIGSGVNYILKNKQVFAGKKG